MTSERSKRRDFLSLIFISKSISKKLLINLSQRPFVSLLYRRPEISTKKWWRGKIESFDAEDTSPMTPPKTMWTWLCQKVCTFPGWQTITGLCTDVALKDIFKICSLTLCHRVAGQKFQTGVQSWLLFWLEMSLYIPVFLLFLPFPSQWSFPNRAVFLLIGSHIFVEKWVCSLV